MFDKNKYSKRARLQTIVNISHVPLIGNLIKLCFKQNWLRFEISCRSLLDLKNPNQICINYVLRCVLHLLTTILTLLRWLVPFYSINLKDELLSYYTIKDSMNKYLDMNESKDSVFLCHTKILLYVKCHHYVNSLKKI